eukprot:jgi/Tetstr1/429570/TSEL_019470.t1
MFGARGQIDLVDCQSSEYKGYRFLLTHIDHGIKFCFCTPMPNKEQPSKIIGLSEEEAKEVIESTKKLLPACQMHDEQLLTRNEDQQTPRAYVPDPSLPWDPDIATIGLVERMMATATTIAWLLGQWMWCLALLKRQVQPPLQLPRPVSQ